MELNGISPLSRYAWAASVLPSLVTDRAAKQILDIGAGDGRMRASVQESGCEYRGFDLFPAKAEIERWDLTEPPAFMAPLAGGALLLDVIEHCDNPGLALRHIAQALAPGAFLVMTMPNPRWSRSRLYALTKGTPICFTQSDLDSNHHVFTTWPHILEFMLRNAGFGVEQYVTLDGITRWPGRPFNLRYPLRWAVAVAMREIERRDSSACGMSYGMVARKMPSYSQAPPLGGRPHKDPA